METSSCSNGRATDCSCDSGSCDMPSSPSLQAKQAVGGIKRSRASEQELAMQALEFFGSNAMLIDIGGMSVLDASQPTMLVLDSSSSVWSRRRHKKVKTSHSVLEHEMSNVQLLDCWIKEQQAFCFDSLKSNISNMLS